MLPHVFSDEREDFREYSRIVSAETLIENQKDDSNSPISIPTKR